MRPSWEPFPESSSAWRFCEASGKCLVRWSGTDPAMIELAKKNAAAIGAGHSFIVFLGDGFFPLNVLNTLKMVPEVEVCGIFCATRLESRQRWISQVSILRFS